MEIKEFISSGIIEIYCMGLASDEEKTLVEKYAAENKEVRDEIESVTGVLNLYADKFVKNPPVNLKKKILDVINKSENSSYTFPPQLSPKSTKSEWEKYFSENNIAPPDDFEMIHLLDLPGNARQTTYLVWAKKGAVVEESHENEDEYLFMLKGNCSVTIDGKIGYYKEGDVIFIPAKAVHRAEALSEGVMVVVGQRVAA